MSNRYVFLLATGLMIAILYANIAKAEGIIVEGTVVDHYEKQTDFIEQSQEVCRLVKIPIYHKPHRPTGAEILGGLVIGGALGKVISGDDKGALAGAVVGGLVTSSQQKPRIVGYSRKRVCEDKIFHRKEYRHKYSHSTISFTINGVSYNKTFMKPGM
ncbi:hypothetical protein OAB70_00465 [bacterium]|nr:hypothetical protein [bacterium]